jgi:hypothetical protein
VPRVSHGAAAIESWAVEYKDILALYIASGDVEGTREQLQQACVTAEVCS